MPSATSGFQLTVIDAGSVVHDVAFTASGEYLISGGDKSVQVWQVIDGKQVATMKVNSAVERVATSKDGRWIAAVSTNQVLVWSATTYEQVFARRTSTRWPTLDIDFSPVSPRLVSADGFNGTATIWDIAACEHVQTLGDRGQWVKGAKYSPEGDRIAIATLHSVQVWDSNSGRLLVHNDVDMDSSALSGLLWFNDHLFVKTDGGNIRRVDASTGSTVSEWSIPGTDSASRIIVPQHGKFVIHASRENITFWGTSTHSQLGLISQDHDKCSIALSPDDQLLAVVTQQGKIVTKYFSIIGDCDIPIDGAILDSWNSNRLTNAEGLLTAAIPVSENTVHHVLASRALVRARLQQWDAALIDAEESIQTQPSIIGYVAKCVTLIGKGEMREGCRVCDAAFGHFHPDSLSLLLLIKAVVLFMAGEHDDGMSRINDLIPAASSNSTFFMVQAYMHFLLGNLHMESKNYENAIQSFEDARAKMGSGAHPPPLIVSLISGWKFGDLTIANQQQYCEALFAVGRSVEAGECVLRMMDSEPNMTESIKAWVSDFVQRCLSMPQNNGNAGRIVAHPNATTMPQQTSHSTHSLIQLSREWARARLKTGSWKDALTAATSFVLPKLTIYQVICDLLITSDHVVDAIACFHEMRDVQQEIGDQLDWSQGFISRCCGKLEDLGDGSMNAEQYDEAISQYTTALSLEPAIPQDLLVKRSAAHAGKGKWEDALNDANEAIRLDQSSPLGYERKYEALCGAGHYGDATDPFETMLSKMSQSSDPEICGRLHRYVETRREIRKTIKDTIRNSPVVLISAISGRLCDKTEQAATFESMPAFMELMSSMTTQIDFALVKQVVGDFYRYTTFSHTWEDREPLFERVTQILVYDLDASPTHNKLQMFCRIVREAGFNWAWSDTCCINKGDHFVLQEALVSMFRWYEGSAMTIIFLRGVDRLAQRGAMMRSLWNTRGWTLQEYHASKVVQFYTEDWTPYLGLDVYNHKDSPEIISEMEEATGISSQALMELCPGLGDIREKLRLASTRQTTRVEDVAYSLLGIFSLTLPVTYGEGDKALGQLLAQLLTSSGDMSILAWTGTSGSFNSCLPTSIAVFSQLPTSHIPLAIPDAEIPKIIEGLRSFDLIAVTRLYDQLDALSVPSCLGRRMRLPCLAFKLGRVSASQNGSERVFRARTNALGIVEIRTEEDLSQLDCLYLVHPWIDFLLDRQPVVVRQRTTEENMGGRSFGPYKLPLLGTISNIASTTWRSRRTRFINYVGRTCGGRSVNADTTSLPPPSTLSPQERQMHVLKFVARLRQPFGALLLTPTRRNVKEYRRVAAESLIRVQIQEITSAMLDTLTHGVQMLDVL